MTTRYKKLIKAINKLFKSRKPTDQTTNGKPTYEYQLMPCRNVIHAVTDIQKKYREKAEVAREKIFKYHNHAVEQMERISQNPRDDMEDWRPQVEEETMRKITKHDDILTKCNERLTVLEEIREAFVGYKNDRNTKDDRNIFRKGMDKGDAWLHQAWVGTKIAVTKSVENVLLKGSC